MSTARNRTARAWARVAVVTSSIAALAVSAMVASASVAASPLSPAGGGAGLAVPAHIAGVVPVAGTLGSRHSVTPRAQDNLTYGGGRVMSKKEISYSIFWVPPTLQDGSPTYISTTYQSLIERYFTDVGGHDLYGNNKQYYEMVGGNQVNIRNRSSAGPVWVDTSPYPPSGCDDPATPNNCLSDVQIKQEVSRAIDANGWTANYTHMFFVFTSYGEGSCFGSGPSGCAFTDYCAYHGYYLHLGRPTIYANMPYLGTTGGCHTPASPNNDIAADSTINVASHEQMEAVTDPAPGSGWTSPQGEIGDKCVWVFGPLWYGGIANVKWNGHLYVLQEEWSNKISACFQG